jgi:hypothetical protein
MCSRTSSIVLPCAIISFGRRGRCRRSTARRPAATRCARAPRGARVEQHLTICRVVLPRTIESSTTHDALARDLGERVELQLDPLLAQALLRLDERAPT